MSEYRIHSILMHALFFKEKWARSQLTEGNCIIDGIAIFRDETTDSIAIFTIDNAIDVSQFLASDISRNFVISNHQ